MGMQRKAKDAHVSTKSDFVVGQAALRVRVPERDAVDDEGVVSDGRLEALEPVPYGSTTQRVIMSAPGLAQAHAIQSRNARETYKSC